MEIVPKKILIVDEDDRIRKILRMYLEKEGFIVVEAGEGKEALIKVFKTDFNLIILDRMLPGINGLEVCLQIRKIKQTPILMLSTRNGEQDCLDVFEAGADDYVIKPISPREVTYRIKAIIGRASINTYCENMNNSCNHIVYPHLVIDPDAHRVLVAGKEVYFALKEYELLQFLSLSPSIVFTREKLLKEIWNYESLGRYRTVDTHIKRIREKLNEVSPEASQLIRTIWGVGYCLKEH